MYAGSQNAAARWSIPVYENLGDATGAFSQLPGAIIGDELYLAGTGILEQLQFSVYNSSSATATMDTLDVDINIYNYDGINDVYVFAGLVQLLGLTPDLDPGWYSTYTTDSLGALGIELTEDILITATMYNTQEGVKPGQIMTDPPTLGASSDNFFLDNTPAGGTTSGWVWFSGDPVANFYWGVGVAPEPASLALLALGALLRRR